MQIPPLSCGVFPFFLQIFNLVRKKITLSEPEPSEGESKGVHTKYLVL